MISIIICTPFLEINIYLYCYNKYNYNNYTYLHKTNESS